MPFIHVHIGAHLTETQRDEIKHMLGEKIVLLPGKSEKSLMIRLDAGAEMQFRGEPGHCAMIQVHLYQASPREAKARFAVEVIAALGPLAGLETDQIFLHFFEHQEWAAGGQLK